MDNNKDLIVNIIQDIATPHNNILIEEFKSQKIKIKLWYAVEEDQTLYPWVKNIAHSHDRADIYGKSLNFNFINYMLRHRHEKFIVVGWMNINTKLLHMIFLLLRIPFNHWTDLPNEKVCLKNKIKRYVLYKVLNKSKVKIFAVGNKCVRYFVNSGVSYSKVVNMPIFVGISGKTKNKGLLPDSFASTYNLNGKDFIISAGSRIVFDKGYDLLIKAISLLDKDILKNIKLIIVGSGPESEMLRGLIYTYSLQDNVYLAGWLDIDSFQEIIKNSRVFIHPARSDAFGGTIYGMSSGVPVIGTYQAGAAAERIIHAKNGFLYDAEDVQALADFISLLYHNRELCEKMAEEAYSTALLWPPKRGVDIFMENMI